MLEQITTGMIAMPPNALGDQNRHRHHQKEFQEIHKPYFKKRKKKFFREEKSTLKHKQKNTMKKVWQPAEVDQKTNNWYNKRNVYAAHTSQDHPYGKMGI